MLNLCGGTRSLLYICFYNATYNDNNGSTVSKLAQNYANQEVNKLLVYSRIWRKNCWVLSKASSRALDEYNLSNEKPGRQPEWRVRVYIVDGILLLCMSPIESIYVT